MAKGRYARVVVRAADVEQLKAFLGSRRLDLGGRPHLAPAKKGSEAQPLWQAEFYAPVAETEGLVAEGCQFVVDDSFIERLQAARQREIEQSNAADAKQDVFKRGRSPKPDADPSQGKSQ